MARLSKTKLDPLRTAYGAAVALVLALAALLAYNITRDPYEERWEELSMDASLASESATEDVAATQEGVGDLEAAILERPELWRRLIPPPPPEKKKPDLAKMLRGVTPTRVSIGSKVEIRMSPRDRSGELLTIGDNVKGARIKQITDDAVVFEVVEGGESYTHRLKRE
jgi:hypothetical protein